MVKKKHGTTIIILINNSNGAVSNQICSIKTQVIDKIGWLSSGNLTCQSQVWLQTEMDYTKSCYQLIITISIEKKGLCDKCDYIVRL